MIKAIGFEGNLRRHRHSVRCNWGVMAIEDAEGQVHNTTLKVSVSKQEFQEYEKRGVVTILDTPIELEGDVEKWVSGPSKFVFVCETGQDANVDKVLRTAWPKGSFIKKSRQGGKLVVIATEAQINKAAKRAQDLCEEDLQDADDDKVYRWIEALRVAFMLHTTGATKSFLTLWKRSVKLKGS